MTEESIGQRPEAYEDDIDLWHVLSVLWQRRGTIVLISFLGAVLSVGYALSLPDIYVAGSKLAPKAEDSNLSSLAGQFGGLAGLAGIDIGGGGTSKIRISLETLKSRKFFEEFLYEEVLVELMAAKGWDRASNSLILDSEIYDSSSLTWLRKADLPFKSKPSVQEAYLVFKQNHFLMSEDKKTGFVELKVRHYSPVVAREWVEKMLQSIERYSRARDILEAEKSITFLKLQSAENSLVSLNEVFANLIEEQTQKVVLANASNEYVFQVIEPPVTAELKSEPQRAIICILGTLFSGMISILYSLIRYYAFDKKESLS